MHKNLTRTWSVPEDDIHRINKEIVSKLDKELHDVLFNKKRVVLSHMKTNVPYMKEINRLLDLNKTKKYVRRRYQFKPNLHWGQLKLLLTEIEFLTIVLKEYKGALPIYFVYAGAAPGDHIWYLQTLFPDIYFELYDPNDFVVKDNAKLKTHVQFFTNKDAEYWASRNDVFLVFCSDIRTEPATSENIVSNMNMQLKWWQIMNPVMSMFKFRLPWEEGKTTYLEGDIYIQPFPGPTSTETRLIVKKMQNLSNMIISNMKVLVSITILLHMKPITKLHLVI